MGRREWGCTPTRGWVGAHSRAWAGGLAQQKRPCGAGVGVHSRGWAGSRAQQKRPSPLVLSRCGAVRRGVHFGQVGFGVSVRVGASVGGWVLAAGSAFWGGADGGPVIRARAIQEVTGEGGVTPSHEGRLYDYLTRLLSPFLRGSTAAAARRCSSRALRRWPSAR